MKYVVKLFVKRSDNPAINKHFIYLLLTSKLLPLHAASTGVNAQNKSLASLNIFLRSPASARSFVLPSLAGEEFDCYLLLKESPPAPRAKRDGLQSQDNWEDIHFHTLSAELSSV